VLGWALNLGFAGSGTADVIPSTIADTRGRLVLIMAGLLGMR